MQAIVRHFAPGDWLDAGAIAFNRLIAVRLPCAKHRLKVSLLPLTRHV